MNNTYNFFIEEFATELKQRINLSTEAWITIEEDIKNLYGGDDNANYSGFFNKIFKNSYKKADATIYLRSIDKREELQRLCSSKEFKNTNKESVDIFIDKLTSVYTDELIKKATSYPKGKGIIFRINKENISILRESLEAGYYDNRIGLYLKAIFEEYASKPSYLREQIFYNEVYTVTESAIRKGVKLKIKLKDKYAEKTKTKFSPKFYFSAYKIVQDKNKTYNYLIGYSERIIDEEIIDEKGIKRKTSHTLEKTPACIRMSHINKIDMEVSMGAKISKEKAKELDDMLNERTAMFMSSEPIEIKVRFSTKGIELFKRQLYMRPQVYSVDPEDDHIYIFKCNEIQALNYFFKFGWDAEILTPETLREKFIIRYQNALQIYNGKTKQEIYKELEEKKEQEENNN